MKPITRNYNLNARAKEVNTFLKKNVKKATFI